ncbi:sugar transferase [Weissella cibaria]
MNEFEAKTFYTALLEKHEPVTNSYLYVKRVFDFLFALMLLIPAAPLIGLFALLIKLETPGSAFYTQERVGFLGKPIHIVKLRSMYQDAEKKSGAMWAQKNDARVTRIGKFVRMTRVDELPQLWNVVRGDMSLIGPRPERPHFTGEFCRDVDGFEKRLCILPGLSGYAQVTGGYEDTPAEKIGGDLYYMEHISIWLDLKIFFKTLYVVVSGHGAR